MRLSSRPDVLRLEAKGDIEGLVQALGYRADMRIQDAASTALMTIGEPAIAVLIDALSTTNLHNAAADLLKKFGVLSIDPLLNVLKTENRASVREAAENILADIGLFAIEPLVVTLTHKNPQVRQSAVKALLAIGSLAVEPLIAQLENKNQPEYTRFDAAKALSILGGPLATSALRRAAQSDASPDVRKFVADALGTQPLDTESITPIPEPVTSGRIRGLSQRFEKAPAASIDAGATDTSEHILNRWSRVNQALHQLKPIAAHVHQGLLRNYAVQRSYEHPFEVLDDLNKEYAEYSRVKESTFSDVSIRLIFDNEVKQRERVVPATRQLEVIIVVQQRRFFMLLNATYIEHYW